MNCLWGDLRSRTPREAPALGLRTHWVVQPRPQVGGKAWDEGPACSSDECGPLVQRDCRPSSVPNLLGSQAMGDRCGSSMTDAS